MDRSKSPNYKIELQKLIPQIAKIKEIARRKGWIYSYDSELDELFFSPKVIPNDAQLFSISDEITVYVNKKSEIRGIFIEYFRSNYLEHQKPIRNITKVFTVEDNGLRVPPKRAEDELEILTTFIQNNLLEEIIQNPE